MIILGIETTCDDTCVAVVRSGREVLANVLAPQATRHAKAQGVVPELASRCHLELLLPAIDAALQEANLNMNNVDALAVATHPGLIGSLLVGTATAQALAWATQKPLIPVNHLLAHIHALFLTEVLPCPFLCLLASGGHTLLLLVKQPLDAEILGSTLDDACGEAFDKVAKHLGLGYPGGPEIDRLSQNGNDHAYTFPVADLKGEPNRYNFSYSGLKTAVIRNAKQHQNPSPKKPSTADLCASFQKAAIDALYRAAKKAQADFSINQLGVCGGVAANSAFRKVFLADSSLKTFFPEAKYCTDNGAMVAALGYAKAKAGGAVDRDDMGLGRASALSYKGKVGERLT